VWPTSGPETNSSSARSSVAEVPQKRHLVHSGIMTRLQLRHVRSRAGFRRETAAIVSSRSPMTTTPPMMAGTPPGGTSESRDGDAGATAQSMSGDGLELELGTAQAELVVVHQLVHVDLLVVDDNAVGGPEVEELVVAVLEADLAVVRGHELIFDAHVA